MELFVETDVSLKRTSICVVDNSGRMVSQGTVISEPEAIAGFIKTKAPQINNSNRNDAAGIARIMQCSWYKEVQVKSLPCHQVQALSAEFQI